MWRSQVARLRLLGLLFCLAGGAAITFGWAGTAQVACVDCQVPYLVSGGAGGVALVVVGTGLLVVAQLRVEGNRVAEQIATLSRDRGRPEYADPDRPTAGGPRPASDPGEVAPLTLAADRVTDETVPRDAPDRAAYPPRIPE